MKPQKQLLGTALVLSGLLLTSGSSVAAVDGKAAYDTFCSGCHPEGKNPLNPAKSLLRMEREANGIKSVADIVRIMRKPGTGMKQFNKKELPDTTAEAIAEYIIKTFR